MHFLMRSDSAHKAERMNLETQILQNYKKLEKCTYCDALYRRQNQSHTSCSLESPGPVRAGLFSYTKTFPCSHTHTHTRASKQLSGLLGNMHTMGSFTLQHDSEPLDSQAIHRNNNNKYICKCQVFCIYSGLFRSLRTIMFLSKQCSKCEQQAALMSHFT